MILDRRKNKRTEMERSEMAAQNMNLIMKTIPHDFTPTQLPRDSTSSISTIWLRFQHMMDQWREERNTQFSYQYQTKDLMMKLTWKLKFIS